MAAKLKIVSIYNIDGWEGVNLEIGIYTSQGSICAEIKINIHDELHSFFFIVLHTISFGLSSTALLVGELAKQLIAPVSTHCLKLKTLTAGLNACLQQSIYLFNIL